MNRKIKDDEMGVMRGSKKKKSRLTVSFTGTDSEGRQIKGVWIWCGCVCSFVRVNNILKSLTEVSMFHQLRNYNVIFNTRTADRKQNCLVLPNIIHLSDLNLLKYEQLALVLHHMALWVIMPAQVPRPEGIIRV